MNCILEKNPLCPAFSEAAAIGFDPDKGRIVKARRDIKERSRLNIKYACLLFFHGFKVKYDVVQEGSNKF